MKTSLYNSLREMVAAPYKVSGLRANSAELGMITTLLSNEMVHTGYYRGRGRYTQAVDLTSFVSNYLTRLGIAHETGNDAERGGVGGNFVKITSPAFLREVKKVQAIRKKEHEEFLRKEMEERKAREEHLQWVAEEAKKMNLEPYRAEICEILGISDEKLKFYDRGLSRKLAGRAAYALSRSHKGFNLDILTTALRSYNF